MSVGDRIEFGQRIAPRANAAGRRTRKLLMQVASQLFAQKGFERTSIKELSLQCNLAIGAVYKHFRTKEDLLMAVLEADFNASPGSGPICSPHDWQAVIDWLHHCGVEVLREVARRDKALWRAVVSKSIADPSGFRWLYIGCGRPNFSIVETLIVRGNAGFSISHLSKKLQMPARALLDLFDKLIIDYITDETMTLKQAERRLHQLPTKHFEK